MWRRSRLSTSFLVIILTAKGNIPTFGRLETYMILSNDKHLTASTPRFGLETTCVTYSFLLSVSSLSIRFYFQRQPCPLFATPRRANEPLGVRRKVSDTRRVFAPFPYIIS
jgi:hypothetical protein